MSETLVGDDLDLEIQWSGDASTSYLKALVVGPSGSGKTRMAATAKDPFYLDAEAGLVSVKHLNVPSIRVESTAKLRRAYMKLAKFSDPDERAEDFGFPVTTVVLDTIDEIQKLFMKERLESQSKEAMAQADWGWLGERMRSVIRNFRNLPMDVVFLCHEQTREETDSGRTLYDPALQGSIKQDIAQFMDIAARLKLRPKIEMVDGVASTVFERIFQTAQDPQFTWLKDRSGRLPGEFVVRFDRDFQKIKERIESAPAPVVTPVADNPDN